MEMGGMGPAGPGCALSRMDYGFPLALVSAVEPLSLAWVGAGFLYIRFRIESW